MRVDLSGYSMAQLLCLAADHFLLGDDELYQAVRSEIDHRSKMAQSKSPAEEPQAGDST